MTKKLCVVMLTLCMLFTLVGCGSGPVGYWKIDTVEAGEVTMGIEDAKSIGLPMVGAVKLQKSGNCEVTLLGEESKGTWEQAEDGTITVNTENDAVYTGSIGEDKVMTLSDAQGVKYTLEK